MAKSSSLNYLRKAFGDEFSPSVTSQHKAQLHQDVQLQEASEAEESDPPSIDQEEVGKTPPESFIKTSFINTTKPKTNLNTV